MPEMIKPLKGPLMLVDIGQLAEKLAGSKRNVVTINCINVETGDIIYLRNGAWRIDNLQDYGYAKFNGSWEKPQFKIGQREYQHPAELGYD